MPEEINRIVTDRLADLLFTHSEDAVENLRREGAADESIHFVGNTMIDSLVAVEERFRNAGVASQLGLRPGGFVLVTLHRPALVDGPLLKQAIAQLGVVGRELPVVFPVHPRTRARLAGAMPAGIRLLEPLGYVDFLSLEADAAAVLTDSGGVQEETTYLGVPCFTLRDTTERPVTVDVGTNRLLGLDPSRIADMLDALSGSLPRRERPPLWDGAAAIRIADVITDEKTWSLLNAPSRGT